MKFTTRLSLFFLRLPQSLYQTAKVSKLLLLMEQGGSAQYAGKSLDEIDFELYNEKNASNSGKLHIL